MSHGGGPLLGEQPFHPHTWYWAVSLPLSCAEQVPSAESPGSQSLLAKWTVPVLVSPIEPAALVEGARSLRPEL